MFQKNQFRQFVYPPWNQSKGQCKTLKGTGSSSSSSIHHHVPGTLALLKSLAQVQKAPNLLKIIFEQARQKREFGNPLAQTQVQERLECQRTALNLGTPMRLFFFCQRLGKFLDSLAFIFNTILMLHWKKVTAKITGFFFNTGLMFSSW